MSLGKNLHHYGINAREVLMENKIIQQTNSPQAQYDASQQNYLRQQIESIVEELKRERDQFVAYRLENKLKALSQDLTEEDRRILSVDDLLTKIREERNNTVVRRYY